VIAQVDGVLFGGKKSSSFALLFELEQFADVFLGVGVVIAVKGLGGRLDVDGAQLLHEIVRPGDAAENERAGRHVLGQDSTAYAPQQLALQGKLFGRDASGEYDCVSSPQREHGLAHAAAGEQTVFGIFWREQYDVEIASQTAVLKAIVKQMKFWAEVGFGQASGCEAVFAYEYGHLQATGDQNRLVAEISRRSVGIYFQRSAAGAAVASGEHVELDATCF
jgi:hypothetical protein